MLFKYQKFPLFSYIIQGENYLNWILTFTKFGQAADSTFSLLYCLAIVTLTMPIWQYLVFPMGSLSTKDICDGRPGTFLNRDFSLSLKSESAYRASNKGPPTPYTINTMLLNGRWTHGIRVKLEKYCNYHKGRAANKPACPFCLLNVQISRLLTVG